MEAKNQTQAKIAAMDMQFNGIHQSFGLWMDELKQLHGKYEMLNCLYSRNTADAKLHEKARRAFRRFKCLRVTLELFVIRAIKRFQFRAKDCDFDFCI